MAVPAGSAARKGFWVAMVAGVLTLAEAYTEPVPGVLTAGLFFLVAWGIWKRRGGAALAGACLLLMAAAVAVSAVLRGGTGAAQFAALLVSAALALIAAWLLLRAARELMAGARVAAALPWALLVLLPVAAFVLWRPYVIPSQAMADTLQPGDRVLVEAAWWRPAREPRYGDIVAFRYPVDPKQTFLKRIVGLPGDRLSMRNKQLYRNGEPVREPWARHKTAYTDDFRDNFPGSRPPFHLAAAGQRMLDEHVRGGELVVPEGSYFVLGDNRDNSLDSRYWGFVSRADILGRAVLIYGSEDWRRVCAGMTR